ncbi:MAG: hypothetical protein F4X92_06090 [Gammaproteobacteria bacterium]|nr:hypothetical protein [Gammaproteobacteria bacterium]
MNLFHTDPFNKYLYSSAFYIQAANCYRPILEGIASTEPEQREALLNMIQDSWLQTMMNAYSSTLPGLGMVNAATMQTNDSTSFVRLTQMLNRITPQIISEVIDRVSKHINDPLILEDFFEIWIETCIKAHAELVNSEEFIDCITDFINFSIKTSVETMKATESKNG